MAPADVVGAVLSAPGCVVLVLACTAVYFFQRKDKKRPKYPRLTPEEKAELIAGWNPDPLVPQHDQNEPDFPQICVDGKVGHYLNINGEKHLNMASMNFLGLIGDERIEKVAAKTVEKYGVGSCGPRGFYGTVDVHLDLEDQLAKFMGCEEAALYSYAFATVASAIPAYAKNGDVIFVDKGANFAIQKGVQVSRARIEWFEHNDVADLERLMQKQAAYDKKNPARAGSTRRFLVAEGISMNSGHICPLPELLALKWKYKVRLFLDESLSFGVLGKTGRGVTEHFDVNVEDVDMIMGSLECAVASTGGFCVGRSFVIDHHVLHGVGYCFSASLPPLLTTAASESLKIIESEPERLQRLRENSTKILRELKQSLCGNFSVDAHENSPIIHLTHDGPVEKAERALDGVVNFATKRKIAITRARYLADQEMFCPRPSIRLAVNSELTNWEMQHVLETLAEAMTACLD